jgi:hypothetical protein
MDSTLRMAIEKHGTWIHDFTSSGNIYVVCKPETYGSPYLPPEFTT